jgi:ubiquitin-like protein Pup
VPERERKRRPKKEAEQPQEEVEAAVDAEAQRLKEEVDAMLDEIDAVLEENAEEFVKGYIQKGGQAVRVFIDAVKEGFYAPLRPLWRITPRGL